MAKERSRGCTLTMGLWLLGLIVLTPLGPTVAAKTPLAYATFLGGLGEDAGEGVATDRGGNVYVAGTTDSPTFPTTPGALDAIRNGVNDVFITKVGPSGSSLVYGTLLGGSEFDYEKGIAVDESGNAYVLGVTGGQDFPTTPGAYNTTWWGPQSVFVVKLGPDGALSYSTFVGTVTETTFLTYWDIAVDRDGNAYIAVEAMATSNFTTTSNALARTMSGYRDVYIAKLNPDGTALLYGTYLGGFDAEFPDGIAVDSNGSAYVSGLTTSGDFPTTSSAADPSFNGVHDTFLAKLDPSGSRLVYATYLGGSDSEWNAAVAIDASGAAYLAGSTRSIDFPMTHSIGDPFGSFVQYMAKVAPSGSRFEYVTLVGSGAEAWARDVAVDPAGNAYLVGGTNGENLPTIEGAFDRTYNGPSDGLLVKVSDDGSTVVYGTYLGGTGGDVALAVSVDPGGEAYVVGMTDSSDFPTTPGAYDTEFSDARSDLFIAKVVTVIPDTIGVLARGAESAIWTILLVSMAVFWGPPAAYGIVTLWGRRKPDADLGPTRKPVEGARSGGKSNGVPGPRR